MLLPIPCQTVHPFHPLEHILYFKDFNYFLTYNLSGIWRKKGWKKLYLMRKLSQHIKFNFCLIFLISRELSLRSRESTFTTFCNQLKHFWHSSSNFPLSSCFLKQTLMQAITSSRSFPLSSYDFFFVYIFICTYDVWKKTIIRIWKKFSFSSTSLLKMKSFCESKYESYNI